MRAMLLAAALAAGCSIDFDRYLATPGASPDGGFFADRPPAGDVPVTPVDAGAPCVAPYVIASLENLANQTTSRGTLLRVEMGSRRRCRDLGGTVLPAQPLAVNTLADGKVLVASRGRVNVFDPATGAAVLSVPHDDANGSLPVDIFPLETPEGPGFAVGYFNQSYINEVDVYTLTRRVTTLRGQVVTIGSSSITSHPTDPTAILVARDDVGEVLTARPSYTGGASTFQPFATIAGPIGVFALPRERGGHVVWVTARDGRTGDGVMRLTTPTTGSPPYLAMGPEAFTCPAARCREIIRAVPDPADGSPIGLCESDTMVGGSRVRHLVRAGDGDDCLLFDGSTLPSNARLSALVVVR